MTAKTSATRSRRPPAGSAPLSPETRWYLESRGYPIPECVPLVRTPEPRMVKGARFDPARVDRVISALRHLRHTQGKWAGRELAPDPWQVAYVLAPVFGWVAPDDDGNLARIIHSAYVEVPRKNGKTTVVSGLLLVLAFADGEVGAQVLTVAASKDQARYAYEPAKTLALHAPALRAAKVRPLRDQITQESTGSYVRVVSSVGDLIHGANIHGACIDELHVHKTSDVLDAVETGTGARTQPLVLTITTAGDGRPQTVYAQRRDYIDRLARRVFEDPATYGVVFAVPDTADPFAEATWAAANPGYGVSPTRAYLRDAAAKAKNSPAELGRFKRLHLGVRTRQRTRFLTLESWDRNVAPVDEAVLEGRPCWGGLDLASTSDLCALAWLFPADDGTYDVLWRLWTPEDNIPALDKRTAGSASVWVADGWMTTTPGNVADYDFIREQINADRARFDVRTVGYDRYNATQLAIDLATDGAEMVKVGQGFASLSGPLKEIQRLLLKGTRKQPVFRHAANPAVRWQVDNLAVGMNPAGDVKPDKATSADKIDAVSAACTGMYEVMARTPPKRSAYDDDHDLIVV